MAAPQAPARRENLFTRKIGPLPMWAWTAIVAGLIIVWSLYQRRKQGQQQAQQQQAATAQASQVPQFVNQTFTTVEPPLMPPPSGGTGRPTVPPPRPAQPVPYRPPAPVTPLPGLVLPHVIGPGPAVIGNTLAQATATINAAGFHVNNVSGNTAGRVVSTTAYSDNSVNIGLN